MQRHVKRLVVAALLVAAAGCTSKPSGAHVTCSPPECASDATLLLVAEVDPPSDSHLVREEFDSSAVSIDPQTGVFTLTIRPQVTLSGTVQLGTGAQAKSVAATVVATRRSRIIGRPDVVYQATVNPVDGSYALVVSQSLSGDEKYTLRVTTTDQSLVPPKTLTVVADADKEVDVTFEPPLTLPELHGTILNSLQQPVANMQVRATTVPTATAPGVVVSTTTVTDASGAYSIRLLPSPPDKVLLTASPTMLADRSLPLLSRTVDTTKLGPTSALTASLTVPPLPAVVQVSYNVVGTGTSGALIPVTAATCTFVADVSDPHATDGTTATFSASSMTDPTTGTVVVDLIPAESGNRTYLVTVSPDATQPFATKTQPETVSPGGYGGDITLSLRAQLSGRIVDESNQPLHNLTVVPAPPTLAASQGASAYSLTATPQQAIASSDGRFSLRLDQGVWDVGLVPPADAMLPRLWLTQLDLNSDLDVGTVIVPRGVMVHGVVRDPYGAPLAHANVRIYTVSSGNAACAPTDQQCLAPPRLRAEGSSGADGIVALILPSQPQ